MKSLIQAVIFLFIISCSQDLMHGSFDSKDDLDALTNQEIPKSNDSFDSYCGDGVCDSSEASSQSCSLDCPLEDNTGNETCKTNSHSSCYSGHVYWYDSCGNRGNLKENCYYGCSGNSCSASNVICPSGITFSYMDYNYNRGTCTATTLSASSNMATGATQTPATSCNPGTSNCSSPNSIQLSCGLDGNWYACNGMVFPNACKANPDGTHYGSGWVKITSGIFINAAYASCE